MLGADATLPADWLLSIAGCAATDGIAGILPNESISAWLFMAAIDP